MNEKNAEVNLVQVSAQSVSYTHLAVDYSVMTL